MSKLGLHVHRWNNRLLDYCKHVGAAVVKSLDHNEMYLREVRQAQPKTILVARLWVSEQRLDDPIRRAREFTDQLLKEIEGCGYDAAEGYNEWDGDLQYHAGDPQGLENWKRYADFEAERSRILHRHGLKSVVGGCSVGTPPEWWFYHFRPALEEGDFLHLHEYSAPAMWDHQNWHCLKYRFVYKYLEENHLPILPLIISECGVDGGVSGRPREGWRKFGWTPRQYMEQWIWIDGEWIKDHYVVGGCAFDCGSTADMGWMSFNIDPEMLNQWMPYVKAQRVTWWGGMPEPTPPPPPAPSPAPQPAPSPQPSPAPPLPSGPYAKFERPEKDNGQGIHLGDKIGPAVIGEQINSCLDMKMTWTLVKYTDKNIGAKAIKTVRAAGIMPIARPYTLVNLFMNFGEQAKVAIEAGTKYIQIYNEPWDGREWLGGNRPDDWWERFRAKWLVQAHNVRAVGGYPGLQLGGLDRLRDMLRWIKAQGQVDIFESTFFALHLYPGKCPPSCTQHEDDALGFLKYAQVFQEEIGFVPPIIVTEWAWSPSEGKPEWYLEVYDWFRTGRLSNGEPLPDYLFAFCAWILHDVGGFGWNYPFYLPLVEALKAKEPFLRWRSEMEIPSWLTDVRSAIQRHPTLKYATRPLSAIDTVVVHHTATTYATPEAIAKWHVENNGWPGPGYHVYIRKSGLAYLMNDLEAISYHCYAHNEHTLGLAFEGDFTKESATEQQIETGKKAVAWFNQVVGKILLVKGHKDMPDNSTACPGQFPVGSLADAQPPEIDWKAIAEKRGKALVSIMGLAKQELE